MKSFRTLAITSVTMMMTVTDGWSAEWTTKVDEDVFSGKSTAVMIGGVGAQLSLYMACDGDRKNTLAVIFQAKDGIIEGVGGELVLKADDLEAVRFSVESYNHNDSYGGFIVDLTAEEAGKLVQSIKSAKRRVVAGLQVPAMDIKASNTLATSGSTKSADLFGKACELSQ